MNVKFFSLMKVSYGIIAILCIISKILTLDTCNVDLMKHYGLSPVKFSVKNKMKICKNVVDSCCNLEDELKIHRLWNMFSAVRIEQYKDDMISSYDNLFSFHEDFVKAPIKRMKMIKKKPRIVMRRVKVCDSINRHADRLKTQLDDMASLINSGIIRNTYNTNSFSNIDNDDHELLTHMSIDPNESQNANNNDLISDRLLTVDNNEKNGESSKNGAPSRLNLQILAKNDSDNRMLNFNIMNLNTPNNIDSGIAHCRYIRKSTTKDIKMINHKKRDFCYTINARLTQFPIEELRTYTQTIKSEIGRLSNIKKSFYCYLCDVKKQLKIDSKKGTIEFSSHFCRSLITEFKDYIRFQNIILIEYIDLILQYIRCFQTSYNEEEFPYNGFLTTYQNNFNIINQCFENINKPDFMSYCSYLCQQYSYTTFNRFFDGNPELLDRVLMTITGFMRKLTAGQDLTLQNDQLIDSLSSLDAIDLMATSINNDSSHNVNEAIQTYHTSGTYAFSVGYRNGQPRRYKKTKIIRGTHIRYRPRKSSSLSRKLKLLNKIDDFRTSKTNSRVDNHKISDELSFSVYDTKSHALFANSYKSLFIDNPEALNPFDLKNSSNFEINQKSLIKAQERKLRLSRTNHEIIQPEVIRDYYSTNDQEIQNFTTDMNMNFDNIYEDESEPQFTPDNRVIF